MFLQPHLGDPFALPITENSDPVRGPIFVEMTRLERQLSDAEGDSPQREDDEKRFDFLLRDAIARRFGFLPCTRNERLRRPDAAALSWSADNQYVHYTGNMFLMVPTEIQLQTAIQQGVKQEAKPVVSVSKEKGKFW